MGFEVQTLVFSKEADWTAPRAVAWAKEHDFRFGSVDETETQVRLRQFDPARCTRGTFRVFPVEGAKGVQATGCRVPDEDDKSAMDARHLGVKLGEMLKMLGEKVASGEITLDFDSLPRPVSEKQIPITELPTIPDGKAIQSVSFDKARFSNPEEAQKWADHHALKTSPVREEEGRWIIEQFSKAECAGAIETISASGAVRLLICARK